MRLTELCMQIVVSVTLALVPWSLPRVRAMKILMFDVLGFSITGGGVS
jgi:hypothetical protein